MRLVTFDTESDGFVQDATLIWCAAAYDHQTKKLWSWRFTGDHADDVTDFLEYLDTADVLCGHNIIGHDLPLMRRLWGVKPRPDQKLLDTLLMSRLQKPDRRIPPHCPRGAGPHSVQSWGYRLGHAKVEHNEWDRFSPEMLVRCEEDVRIQVKILQALEAEGKGENWGPALRLTMRLFTYLREQEARGFAVDRSSMERAVAQLTRWIDKIDRAVKPHLPLVLDIKEGKVKGEYGYVRKPFKKDGSYSAITERFLSRYAVRSDSIGYVDGVHTPDRLVGGPFARISFRYTDLDSNAETKDFLLKSGWVPQQWNTNNDGARTSPKLSQTEEFEGVSGSLGKLVAKRVVCRQRRGVVQGWLDYLDGSPRLSQPRLPAIVSGLAVTGRARHKLVVNVPGSGKFFGRQMRSMFIATPKMALVGIDSKGNQIRQLAARMGDADFSRIAIDPNVDIHSYNAERAGGISRSAAKTFFYALIFGAGNAKIARNLGISLAEAKDLRDSFFRGMPTIPALLERLRAEWMGNGGWIRGLDGRPLFVPSEHMLLVYLLQSDEAIQMSHAYCRTYERCSVEFGPPAPDTWGFVLWVHDEYQIECRPEWSERIAAIGCDAITWAGRELGIPVPHEGDAKIGGSWRETH